METVAQLATPVLTLLVSVITATFTVVRVFLQTLPIVIFVLLVSLLAASTVRQQSRIISAVECGFRSVGYFYEERIQPFVVQLSKLYNPLSCYSNAYYYMMGFFIQNTLWDVAEDCNVVDLVPPVFGLVEAVSIDILFNQVMNYQYVLTQPVNSTAIEQPIKDIGAQLETIMCCGCNDLCFLWQWALSPLQDDNLFCVIQSAFDAIFWALSPALDYAFWVLSAFAGPIPRPNFKKLADALCSLTDCAVKLLANVLQYANDNIVGLFTVNVGDIACSWTWAWCTMLQILAFLLESLANADRIIAWPTDTYISEALRGNLALLLNMIALPTEVVRIEDTFPAYLTDDIGTSGYDYSTQLLPSQLPLPITLQTCLCNTMKALTLNIVPAQFDMCSITNGLVPLVDAIFFVMDLSLNIYRFDQWAPRMDPSFLETLFLPDGAMSIIPAAVATFDADLGIVMEVMIAGFAELGRWLFELTRLAFMGKDQFGLFLPDSLYSDTRIRCSRYPTADIPEAVSSCDLQNQLLVFSPAYRVRAIDAICRFEGNFEEDFKTDDEKGTLCKIARRYDEFITALSKLSIRVIYGAIFSDPDDYFAGPGDDLQQDVENLVVASIGLGEPVCNFNQRIFRFLDITPTADPCLCTRRALEKLGGSVARILMSIAINLARDFDVNGPYFQAGQQQSPGIQRSLLSNFGPTGRPTNLPTDIKGDVERVIEAYVELMFCPLSLADLLPQLGAVVDVWQNFISGILQSGTRSIVVSILSVLQGNGDFFFDFTTSVAIDTYPRTVSMQIMLYANTLDLIHSPITWSDFNQGPDLDNINTQTPDEYPTSLDGPLDDYVSADIFAAGNANGVTGDIPTLGEAIRLTSNVFFLGNTGYRIVCPLLRVARMLISLAIFALEFVGRVGATFNDPGSVDDLLVDWFFGCEVSATARAFSYDQLKKNPSLGGPALLARASPCADLDGFLIAFVQVFRCPCDWLQQLSLGPLQCLCGSQSFAPDPNSSRGIGIINSFSELLAEVARVTIVTVRRGLTFNGDISISKEIIAPIMISVTRAIYGATCIMSTLFGDECSTLYWYNLIKTSVRLIFSIPFFMASMVDRTMQNSISISKSDYAGGQPGFSNVGYNRWRFNSKKTSECDPNLNERACNRDDYHQKPNKPDPGEEGMFTIVAQTIYPATQIGIDALQFANCAIEKSLSRAGSGAAGVASFAASTVGGLVEVAKAVQSVFFSILHFAWQMFEMMMWFFTRKVGGWSQLLKAGKLGYKLFKTIIRSLTGYPMDSHIYFGEVDVEGIEEDCRDNTEKLGNDWAAHFISAGDPISTAFAKATAKVEEYVAACVAAATSGQGGNPAATNYLNFSPHADKRDVGLQTPIRNLSPAEEAQLNEYKEAYDKSLEGQTMKKWIHLMITTSQGIYSGDELGAMAAMNSAFNQKACRHDDIAACICPWEPEIAYGTPYCQKDYKMTEEDERQLLALSSKLSFTGTTKCDSLVRHMSLNTHWSDSTYMEKEDLAECLALRATSVHAANEFCAVMRPGEPCMWPRNMWYQPDRTAAWLAANRAHDLWLDARSTIRVGKDGKPIVIPSKAERRRRSEEVIGKLFNDTRIPEETWKSWVPPREPDAEPPRRESRRGRRRAPIESPRARRRRVHREQRIRAREGDPVFLAEVQRNLTAGVYDRPVTAWLRGKGDMPLDIKLRPYGLLLLNHTATLGTPCLLVKEDAHYRSRNWRRGEQDGDPELLKRLMTGPKAELDDYVFEHYNKTDFTGYRMPSAAHRRVLTYVLRGWKDHSGHRHRRGEALFKRRSPEENLATFEERRNARLRSVTQLAIRAGVVGPDARDIHGIPPPLQQLHLDGMQAVDYLIYGTMTGAFSDGIDRYNAMTDKEIEQVEEDSPWSHLYNFPSKAWSEWGHINAMLREGGGYGPNDLPSLAWNGTYNAIDLARTYFTGQHREEEDIYQRSRNARYASLEMEPIEEEEAEDKNVYFSDIVAAAWSPPWANNSTVNATATPTKFWQWWDGFGKGTGTTISSFKLPPAMGQLVARGHAPLATKHSPSVYLQRGAILQSYMEPHMDQRTVSQHRRRREAEERDARFLFTGGCRIISHALDELLRVVSHCPTTPAHPFITTRNRHMDDDKAKAMTIWMPMALDERSPAQMRSYTTTASRAEPGASEDYGPVFSDLERLAKFFDYLMSRIPLLNRLDFQGRLQAYLTDSNNFFTNTNYDEDAGPVGLLYWLRVWRRCDFPQSIDCSRGVGAVQAAKDVFIWFSIGYLIIAFFVPWSSGVPLIMMMMPLSWVIFTIHAWRYSPMCFTKMMVPVCALNELDAVITTVFSTCYTWLPDPWIIDGNKCPPKGVCINILDCRSIYINSGFAVIAGLSRLVSVSACSRVAGFLESFLVLGPYGAAPQALSFLRQTCDRFRYAGDELVAQQNWCLGFNAMAMAPTGVIIGYGLLALYWILTVGFAVGLFLYTVFYILKSSVMSVRPEDVPGTGSISEALQEGDD